ncbi:unnamed protein product [Ilex paraguariensis]|uniref:Uncharacterized protein n=1 Tax=Ilex paraguariensis TaxID=185542 RepID=A0ABC8S7E9_9AQUA
MDPFYEEKLREDVNYLHSLWRHCPARPNPNHHTSTHLQASSSTKFKKERKTIRAKNGRKSKIGPPRNNPSPVSDIEWPCEPPIETPPATTSGWPELKLRSIRTTRLPSAEEEARFAANRVQQKALKATQDFLMSNADSDDDNSDGDDEMEEDDEMDEDGCKEDKFFLKVLKEDSELRGYYEKNYGKGEFCCLVCGGVGKKAGKRFKDCVALVQHSMSIAKTKKRRAHRAYGLAICEILGWDIDRLPTIVLSLAKSVESQVHVDDARETNIVDSENNNTGGVVPENVSILCGSLPNDSESMICEHSLIADASKCMEDLDEGILNTVEANSEGEVNCLCRNISTRMVLKVLEMK